MAVPDITDFTSMIISSLGISPLSLIISFPLGFVILYSILFKNSEWNRVGEIGKTIFSFFIGYSIFTITRFFVWFLIMPISAVLYQSDLPSQTDNIVNTLLAAFFIFYLADFIQNKRKKEGIINIIFKVFLLSTALVIFVLLIMLTSIYFSSLSFISGFTLVFIFLSFIFSFFGAYIIILFLKNRQIKKVTSFKIKISKRNRKYISTKYVLIALVIIFTIFTVILSFLIPHVTYYDIKEKEVLIDGNRLSLFNQQFWSSYRNVEMPIKIENSGYLGWIPIDYKDIITNVSDPYFIINTSDGVFNIQEHAFPNEYITKLFSLKNATIDKPINKFILFFDKYTFLDSNKIGIITLNGYKGINLSKESYNVKYFDPEISENSVLIKIPIENNMPNDIEFKNIGIFYSGNRFSSCILNNSYGEFTNYTNTRILSSSCSSQSCESYSYFDYPPYISIVMEGNNVMTRSIKLSHYSKVNIIISLNCTK